MALFLLQNMSGNDMALPFPYRGDLKAGKLACITAADETTLANLLGGADAIKNSLRIYPAPAGAVADSHDVVGTGGAGVADASIDSNAIGKIDALDMSPEIVMHFPVAAGAGGSADDVTVLNANAPFDFKVLSTVFIVTTNVSGKNVQLFPQAAGAGTALSTSLSANATGRVSDAGTAPQKVSKGGSLFLRRSDSGVAGNLLLFCQKV